jgi:hypothetical protein
MRKTGQQHLWIGTTQGGSELKRTIGALAIVALLVVASAAIAASGGRYRGFSTLHLDGFTASHPFDLTVKNGRITDAAFLAGSNCGALDGLHGIRTSIKISDDRFNGRVTIRTGGGLHLIGRFSGRRVTGTFTGMTKGGSESCAKIPRTSFSANLP